MAELVVIGYPDTETAQKALDTVQQLEKDLILQTGGAAVVRNTSEGKVEMVTKTGATSAAPLGGRVLSTAIVVMRRAIWGWRRSAHGYSRTAEP